MTPFDIVQQYMFEPVDNPTREGIRQTLQQAFPEATWEVEIVNRGISITPIFNTPEDRTFYTLKWF